MIYFIYSPMAVTKKIASKYKVDIKRKGKMSASLTHTHTHTTS